MENESLLWNYKHNIEIVMLYTLKTIFNFDKNQLLKFYDAYTPALNCITERYANGEFTEVTPWETNLVSIGVLLSELNKEKR